MVQTESWPWTNEQVEAIRRQRDALMADNVRLRKGIQDYLDGNYEPKIKKMDKCPHGRYGYEICESCTDEHFQRVLGPT